jgi:transposase InsO family protein
MAWRNIKVEEQRQKAMLAYESGHYSIVDICKEFSISRPTFYKWHARFLENSKEGLKDLSKAPHDPYKRYTDEQIDIAVNYKLQHKTWGPRKILSVLKEEYPHLDWPSPTRLYEVFKGYHLVTPRRIRGRVPATAPLGNLKDCNDTWSVDLKGWFLTGDGTKCEPLTITDCHSRYLIKCLHLKNHSAKDVWPIFKVSFLEYGLPNRIRSDNGPPFGSVGAGRLTMLSVNLIKAGVTPEWIRPGHPEENGRHERFHLTLKQDVASPPKATIALQNKAIDEFKYIYNYKRPHEALGMKTPGSVYRDSKRVWDGKLRSPEYDLNVKVRKVCSNGCIWINQKDHYITQSLEGEYVGLKEDEEGDEEVYYGPIYLGKISRKEFEKPKLKTRRPR